MQNFDVSVTCEILDIKSKDNVNRGTGAVTKKVLVIGWQQKQTNWPGKVEQGPVFMSLSKEKIGDMEFLANLQKLKGKTVRCSIFPNQWKNNEGQIVTTNYLTALPDVVK